MVDVMLSMEDIKALSIEDIKPVAARFNLDLDSISLPYAENFGIDSDDEDLENEEEMEELEDDFSNIIVVGKLPNVPKEKFHRLGRRVRQIYDNDGLNIKEDGFWMPIDSDTQQTLGYCFIEFNTPQEAERAKEMTHGYKLGESHYILDVYMFNDIDKLKNISSEWTPPQNKPYTPLENLQKWLTDEKGRDQFVIRAGSDTEVLWNDARQSKPELVYNRAYWTEGFVKWSPLGTYLATVHEKGAAVWGGATTFDRLRRYNHPQVKLIDFSPGERFLVTYSSQEPCDTCHEVAIRVFDVKTGKVRREFKGSAAEFGIGVNGLSWPVFRWGGGTEDKYFSRIGKNAVYVYETETFGLVGKKSIKVDNVIDLCCSPTDSILALYVPELGGGNRPARVCLVQIPSKQELRQKNLFSVSDCKFYWQCNGDYLAVKLERYTKTKKSTHTGFEIFRVKERDMPIEVFELENNMDKVVAFAWEPSGHRFAVIHGDDNPSSRPDVSFYSMRSGRVSKLATLKGRQANSLHWSPSGCFIVLAGLKGFNGQLEFYNVDELETMAQAEHFMAADVEWDPTGRYVVTSVHDIENGFTVWSFSGKLVYRILKDNFFQFMWRPRPLSLLTAEKQDEIAKNLKQYSKKYEAEDEDVSTLLSEQDRMKRKMLIEEWKRWVREWRLLHEEDKLERQRLLDDDDDDEEEEEAQQVEVEVEDLLGVTEEIISFD